MSLTSYLSNPRDPVRIWIDARFPDIGALDTDSSRHSSAGGGPASDNFTHPAPATFPTCPATTPAATASSRVTPGMAVVQV